MNYSALAVAIILCASSANAAPQAKQLLGSSVQDLQRAGFYGADSAAVPAPPAAIVSASVAAPQGQAPDDHAKEVLRKFSTEILATSGIQINLDGAAARKLGFAPTSAAPWNPDGSMPIKGIYRQNNSTGEKKSFAATTVRGKTDIVISYMKGTTDLRTYLVSPDGTLEAYAVYTANGSIDVPPDQAQAAFQTELGFWVRYYDKTHP